MIDSSLALVLLYLARYVRRDVNTGNIILVSDAEGRLKGKINDLEYAKPFENDNPGSDSKTVYLVLIN